MCEEIYVWRRNSDVLKSLVAMYHCDAGCTFRALLKCAKHRPIPGFVAKQCAIYDSEASSRYAQVSSSTPSDPPIPDPCSR